MAKKTSKKINQQTFEVALKQVEATVDKLENQDLGLEEALDAYEAGIQALKFCQLQLQAAQQRIAKLSGFDADGNPLTEPLEDRPTLPESETEDWDAMDPF